jgi:hypothetical protein
MSDEERTKTRPHPGSKEAEEQGCTCPIFDNARGHGACGQPNIFWVNADCPIHGTTKESHEER